MNDGRIQQADTATRLYEDPVNQFVAEFIYLSIIFFLQDGIFI